MDRRIQNLLITVFKTINTYPPEYLRDLFRLRDKIKNLREVNKLQVPKPNTTRYGKNSVKYLAAITWKLRMFSEQTVQSELKGVGTHGTLLFLFLLLLVVWNMCENLHCESVYVYFKELHNDQEYY